jgi:hypothetical protein
LTAGTMMNAVVNQLDGEGFQMCVDAELAHQFGSTRVCAGRPGQYLMVRSEPFETPAPAGATTLAISDPLSAAERVEADTITQELSEILIAFDRADAVPLLYSPLARLVDDDDPPPELISRSAQIERLNDLRQIPGTRYGLYLVPV